jgi:hypothetical protein
MDKNGLNEDAVKAAVIDFYDKTTPAGNMPFDTLNREFQQYMYWRMSDAIKEYLNATKES